MLDVAARRARSPHVRTQVADAQDLPFDSGSFDLVVCQFGVMFYPDKVRGNAEARRVLREGGRYLLVIWDRLDRNPGSLALHQAVTGLFPDDPPNFLARTPFGYGDPAGIERDLLAAGFTDIELETVTTQSGQSASAEDAVMGLVYGCPLKAEIEARNPAMLPRAEAAARAALAEDFPRTLSAHVVTAIR
jgi:SAM-dependent methyltransferase